jgi:hypothetical protein
MPMRCSPRPDPPAPCWLDADEVARARPERARLRVDAAQLAAVVPEVHRRVVGPGGADQALAAYEGTFVLSRALTEPGLLQGQLRHLRTYLELLFAPEA